MLHLILPVFTIACSEIAVWIRYVRSSMLEVLHQDYMRTAKAKGRAAAAFWWFTGRGTAFFRS
ncbi:ABC transporter permease subunit [Paenibacillus sp. P25]|nr:ABC transporter permease subunit [Paenibacillus sp. P25]